METTNKKTTRPASTLTINGKLYDAITGKPIDVATHQPLPKTRSYGSFDVKPAATMHAGPSRSQTLRRSNVSRPQAAARPLASRHTRTISPVATHPSVTRFGRPNSASTNTAHVVTPSEVLSAVNRDNDTDRPVGLATQVQNYTPSMAVARPHKQVHKSTSHKIAEHQLAKAPGRAHHAAAHKAAHKAAKKQQKNWFARHIKLTPPVVITGIVIVVLGLGALCYYKVPALSLFVAAKSAGVQATYPNYVPAGYHFKGPVTYGNEDVKMNFTSASGSYTIDQKSSYLDSGAVLDSYVLPNSQNYLTYSQGGITVYTFGSQAAWVNGGVLHTISGNAQLSSDQILQIVGSM